VPLDTASFEAFQRSLNLTTPVTTRAGRMIEGPPAWLFELGLRLGLARWFLNTPRNLGIMEKVGIPPAVTLSVINRLHSRAAWRAAWQAATEPHLQALQTALVQNDPARAINEIKTALIYIDLAGGGDHYYFHTRIPDQAPLAALARDLYKKLHELSGEVVERITIPHPHGTTTGLLHFPSGAPQNGQRYPVLLGLHGVAGDKDAYDYLTRLFREAGYATLCVDMPAHGENLGGPPLQFNDEVIGVAALEKLATHPQIDPQRIGVLGSSMGGFWALRVTAASAIPKTCLAFAPAYDVGYRLNEAVYGIQDYVAYVIGARTFTEAYEIAKPFHLRDVLGNIRCPVAIVHGTQDHICSFLGTYEIARRIKTPLSVFPLLGVDHEGANPSTLNIAAPGLEWLKQNL